jgi:hypothetical protein
VRSNRWAILARVMGAQTTASVGPFGIPAIAPPPALLVPVRERRGALT